jgi:hypothetical protein
MSSGMPRGWTIIGGPFFESEKLPHSVEEQRRELERGIMRTTRKPITVRFAGGTEDELSERCNLTAANRSSNNKTQRRAAGVVRFRGLAA